MTLPVAETWFKATRIDDDTTLIIEPHIHVLEQANMWLVEGSERDMILDTGMSVAAYRETFNLLKDLPVTTVHGGHDPSFGRARMLEIIATYEAIWDAA